MSTYLSPGEYFYFFSNNTSYSQRSFIQLFFRTNHVCFFPLYVALNLNLLAIKIKLVKSSTEK